MRTSESQVLLQTKRCVGSEGVGPHLGWSERQAAEIAAEILDATQEKVPRQHLSCAKTEVIVKRPPSLVDTRDARTATGLSSS